MPSRKFTLLVGSALVAVLLGMGGVRRTSAADEEQPLSLIERLGTPARPDAVRELVAEALDDGPDQVRQLAFALAQAGGTSAAHGLQQLLRHADLDVRVSVLDAARRVSVRTERITRRARESLHAIDEVERCAAIRALGAIGDGEDVPALLLALSDASAETRLTACEALRALGGPNLPPTPARWAHWWRRQQCASAKMSDALEALVADPEAPVDSDLILESGWTDLPAVVGALRFWFRDGEPEALRLAFPIVARYRLGDFADDVRWSLRFGDAKVLEAARTAAAALRLPADPSPEPTTSTGR